ncbi:MAG: ABC transporter permease [Acidobacteria bacterium]|nr:ABC transporter permease [Acidobacteriota bacterium]
MARDLRYAARQLRRSPGFAATAALTVGLAIAANVAVFGVLNALVLRPLDVPQPEGLYNIAHRQAGYDNQSYPDYRDFRDRNSTFSGMAAYRIQPGGLSTGAAAFKVWYYRVSGNYFDLLGVRPEFGRFFHSSDERGPDSAPYIVLSDSFWRAHFGAGSGTVGALVEINQHPFTVIGIAPPSFHGTEQFFWPDFWMPIIDVSQDEARSSLEARGSHGLWIIGKLKPGAGPAQATDDLNAIARALARQYPDDDNLSARLVKPGMLGDVLGDPTRQFVTGVMVLALLVLLAAATNLASIFAARNADRTRELAIRLAIGSSRWHIARQLLMEAVLVSLAGGLVGTLFSAMLLRGLSRWQPFAEFPIRVTVNPDLRVYAAGLGLALFSGALFGLLPLGQLRTVGASLLMRSPAGYNRRFRRFAFRDLLLGLQIALCSMLVTASIVALRGMQRSLTAPLGFQPQGRLLAVTDLHMAGHSDRASAALQRQMLESAARLPGQTAAGIINQIPLGTGGDSWLVYPEGTTDFRTKNSAFGAKLFAITPGYLQAAGTRLLAGRDLNWHDDESAPGVAIINATFARAMFHTLSAVGMRFSTAADKTSREVVGIVEDGKYDSLAEAPWPAMFFPLMQHPDSNTTLVVRSLLPPSEAAPAVNRMLTSIDWALPFTLETWNDELAFVLFPARVATAALGVMGLLAAMLAVTGVFGMATYAVSKRLKELGIRVALGAHPAQVIRSAIGRPVTLLLAGTLAGVFLGVLASQVLAQIVYQATPRDPVVLAGVLAAMAGLGMVAVWTPARNAMRVSAWRLLREE